MFTLVLNLLLLILNILVCTQVAEADIGGQRPLQASDWRLETVIIKFPNYKFGNFYNSFFPPFFPFFPKISWNFPEILWASPINDYLQVFVKETFLSNHQGILENNIQVTFDKEHRRRKFVFFVK